MIHQTSFEVCAQDDCFMVDLQLHYYIENDGIGGYEYWGAKGYDKGFDYPVIEYITWNKEQYTKEQNQLIEEYVWQDKQIKHLENIIEKSDSYNQYQ